MDELKRKFERWAYPQGFRLDVRDMAGSQRLGQYCADITQAAWEAWQASARAAAPNYSAGNIKDWVPLREALRLLENAYQGVKGCATAMMDSSVEFGAPTPNPASAHSPETSPGEPPNR